MISAADLPLRRSWPPGNLLLALCALVIGLAAGLGIALWREASEERTALTETGRPVAETRPAPTGAAPAGAAAAGAAAKQHL